MAKKGMKVKTAMPTKMAQRFRKGGTFQGMGKNTSVRHTGPIPRRGR